MSLPLEGVKVLDLSRLLPGPYCTMLMADMGADVVKIEDPEAGDYIRWWPPYVDGLSATFMALNRNKKSATLNLKHPRGAEIFLRLIERSDIVVESFRPGVLERLGVGYEKAASINPRIIYCALTGYGQDGPYRDFAGHDINFVGYTGVLSLNAPRGGKPIPAGAQIGDMTGALSALSGILAALYEREKSGLGQFVDISLTDSAFSMMPLVVASVVSGDQPQRAGETPLNGGQPCYGVYETSDGKHVCLGAIEPKFFKKFCELTGRKELAILHFSNGKDRDRLDAELTALFKTKTSAEWRDLLEKEDICFGPVNTPEEAIDDPHIRSRGMLIEVETGKGSKILQTASPIKFSRTPPAAPAAPPDIGAQTAEILELAGIGPEELVELKQQKVIR